LENQINSIQVGEKMPAGELGVMTNDGAGAISTDELFVGKKVVLVSVPGAFTQTCSSKHLPGFLKMGDQLVSKGVDTVAFMAVNDVSVMHAWGEHQGVGSNVLMLADGNGEYAEALGIAYDASAFGMGTRGLRAVYIVEDGTATHIAVEAPGQFEVSSADAVLAAL
jgi:peroxiredoxin